jgi:hypothetical protein
MGKSNKNNAKRRAKKKEQKAQRRKEKSKRQLTAVRRDHVSRTGKREPIGHPDWVPRTGYSGLMVTLGNVTPMAAALEIEVDLRYGYSGKDLPLDLPTLEKLRTLTDEDLYQTLEQFTGVPVDPQTFISVAQEQIHVSATATALWGSALDANSASAETRARVEVCSFELWNRLVERPCRERMGLLRLNLITKEAEQDEDESALVQSYISFWQELLRLAGPTLKSLKQLESFVDIIDPDLSGFGHELVYDTQVLARTEPLSDIVARAAEVLEDVARRAEDNVGWELSLEHAFILATMNRQQEAEAKARALCSERPKAAKGHVILSEIAYLAEPVGAQPRSAALKAALAHLNTAADCEDADDLEVDSRLEDILEELSLQA